ncbi:hypothetical protein [Dehalobacterium formicoaceticum]|uniref:Uncharacterized protein n=1 Tax=Dehalobacterium formicoaceticum TaxID=51515 RepID=A0ABT1Y3Q8_9FIRM|nr:hypothetical protein [Dehalobacterium formicoaceticum]MCR6545507.1 hypothetical protein [Dehalobacterium formicoaceticum]
MKEFEVQIEKIESAIPKMLLINPTDIRTDKIKLLCMNNDSDSNININGEDEIYQNSKNMLHLYEQLLNTGKEVAM